MHCISYSSQKVKQIRKRDKITFCNYNEICSSDPFQRYRGYEVKGERRIKCRKYLFLQNINM